jgi:hypothetical protein
VVYGLVIVIATTECVARACNNFFIFRTAYGHLLAGRDLYVLYPSEHLDLFKYSPTFALLFAPFALLPFAPALLLWNALNVGSIYLALRIALPARYQQAVIPLVGIGLVTTVDGTQSNGLVAALIVLAFALLERNRLVAAAAAIAGGALVKIFPLAALAFVFPRRDRMRFAMIFAAVFASLIALPLVVLPVDGLADAYRSWYAMGATDALDRGASVMKLLHELTGYDGPNAPVQLAGVVIVLLPLLVIRGRWANGSPEFRLAFLASVLVFSVIFNHKAEQPSFIIALVGVAIWYAITPRSPLRTVLTAAVFVSTVPIFLNAAAPGVLGPDMSLPLEVAAGACTLVWMTMQADLLELAPATAGEIDGASEAVG